MHVTKFRVAIILILLVSLGIASYIFFWRTPPPVIKRPEQGLPSPYQINSEFINEQLKEYQKLIEERNQVYTESKGIFSPIYGMINKLTRIEIGFYRQTEAVYNLVKLIYQEKDKLEELANSVDKGVEQIEKNVKGLEEKYEEIKYYARITGIVIGSCFLIYMLQNMFIMYQSYRTATYLKTLKKLD